MEASSRRLTAREVLSQRMKGYEEKYDMILPPSQPYLLRLDGRAFSTFSKRFLIQPFDDRFVIAMCRTAEDLVRHFTPSSAYVQSDEITLVFPVKESTCDRETNEPQEHTFSGRVIKLVSITAGFASVRFAKHIRDQLIQGQDADLDLGTPHFDCRAFSVPDEDEVLAAIHWRCAFDCVRNSEGRFADALLGHRVLHKLGSQHRLLN
jgi:tRNA(His) guanylyltransferase